MSPGTHGRAPRPGEFAEPPPTLPNGGSTFAECPELAAPDARIIWRAELDPGTLEVGITPTIGGDPEGVDPAILAPWLTVTADPDGVEHAVLSDGWHHIRLDVGAGSLTGPAPIIFSYRIRGLAGAIVKLLPLRRMIDLCRHSRFAATLFPEDRRIARGLLLLRVHDALVDGASQREIAVALYGVERTAHEWAGRSDSLRSRVKRLVRDARAMASGGYRSLLLHPGRNGTVSEGGG